MIAPPSTVEIVTRTSGWSKPSARIAVPKTTMIHTTAK
jgi:hypothetical protein